MEKMDSQNNSEQISNESDVVQAFYDLLQWSKSEKVLEQRTIPVTEEEVRDFCRVSEVPQFEFSHSFRSEEKVETTEGAALFREGSPCPNRIEQNSEINEFVTEDDILDQDFFSWNSFSVVVEEETADDFWKDQSKSIQISDESQSSSSSQLKIVKSETAETVGVAVAVPLRIEIDHYDEFGNGGEESFLKKSAVNFFAAEIFFDDQNSPSAAKNTKNDVEFVDSFGKRLVYFDKLPVMSHRAEILEQVRESQITVIAGSTGCGKSSHIPLFLMDEMMARPETADTCNILVAMPRRIAATSLCSYVCALRGYREGAEIGYQVGLAAPVRSKKTKILYTTTGVFVQKLCQDSSRNPEDDCLSGYSHVILDEIHERSEEVDFALLMVRLIQSKTKILIMSATMDAGPILEYLKDQVQLTLPPFIQIRKNLHDVEEHYVDEICTHSPNFLLEKPFCSDLLMSMVMLHIDRKDLVETGRKLKGTILIFLPGLEHIEMMWAMFKEDYPQHFKSGTNSLWEICLLHSQLPQQYQSNVFRNLRPYVRRIVLATNIAESSITVPNVEIVYDFCLTKRMVTDEETQMSYLQMQWATKSNCDQRKGRAGRTQNGKVYRLVQQNFYERFNSHPLPEILATPPTATILRFKIIKFRDSPLEIFSSALSKPKDHQVQRAVFILKEKGALSLYHHGILKRDDGDLTFLGRLCFLLPFSPSLSRLVYLAFAFGMVDDGIIIACLTARNIFSSGLKFDNESFLSKKKFDGGFRSDSLASFRAFREWMFEYSTGRFPKTDENDDTEQQWCQRRFLSLIRLREVRMMVTEIRTRLYDMGLCEIQSHKYFQTLFEPDHTWELIMKIIIAGAFYPDYVISSAKTLPTDTAESLAAAAAINSAHFGGFDPTRTVKISMPGNLKFLMPIFYDQQLRNWLSHTLKTDEIPSILYHGKTAAVTFEPAVDDIPGETVAAVELLIRQSNRNKFNRRTNKTVFDTVNEQSGRTLLEKMPELVPYTTMSPETLPWFQLEKDSLRGQFPPTAMPDISVADSFKSLTICHVMDACSFFGRLYDLGDLDPIVKIDREIGRMKRAKCTRATVPSDAKVIVGRCVLAPFETARQGLARGRVTRTYSSDLIEVFFVDYGVHHRVRFSTIQLVPSGKPYQLFWTEPALAVEFALPNYLKYCGWNEKQPSRLFPSNVELSCSIAYCRRKVMIVSDIRAVDSSGRCRSLVALAISNDLLSLDPFALPPVTVPEISVVTIPSSKVLPLLLPSGQVQPFGGSDSPFEIHSCGGYQWTYNVSRLIKIHNESINNVLIRKQKPDPVNFVLVSQEAFVSKNKNSVVVSQTTLMPHLPAMAALLSCLFAPVVEIRFDPESTNPVIFKCGLGASIDPSTKFSLPLFPDHDFITVTDGLLDMDDIFTIDHLRRAINSLPVEANDFLLSENLECEKKCFSAEISQSQAGLRELLLTVFRRVRSISVNPLAKFANAVSDKRWTSVMPDQIILSTDAEERRLLLNRIMYDVFCDFNEKNVTFTSENVDSF